jgi:hypothetical protein
LRQIAGAHWPAQIKFQLGGARGVFVAPLAEAEIALAAVPFAEQPVLKSGDFGSARSINARFNSLAQTFRDPRASKKRGFAQSAV